ncbi:hypothetical protein P355_3684 [Burkholderia cenocepacia KC-01]|nr:hypothetical protein P355_3684 [Burkholderia cenocepacia KC-01]
MPIPILDRMTARGSAAPLFSIPRNLPCKRTATRSGSTR